MDYQQIDITLINEPEEKLEQEDISELLESFQRLGTFLLPLVLCKLENGKYAVINGEPQYWAATHALNKNKGKTKIQVNAFVANYDELTDTMKQEMEYQMDFFESTRTRPYPQGWLEGLLEKAKAKEEEGLLYEVDLDPEPEAEEEERLELDLDPEPEPNLQRRIELLEEEIRKLWSKVGK